MAWTWSQCNFTGENRNYVNLPSFIENRLVFHENKACIFLKDINEDVDVNKPLFELDFGKTAPFSCLKVILETRTSKQLTSSEVKTNQKVLSTCPQLINGKAYILTISKGESEYKQHL